MTIAVLTRALVVVIICFFITIGFDVYHLLITDKRMKLLEEKIEILEENIEKLESYCRWLKDCNSRDHDKLRRHVSYIERELDRVKEKVDKNE